VCCRKHDVSSPSCGSAQLNIDNPLQIIRGNIKGIATGLRRTETATIGAGPAALTSCETKILFVRQKSIANGHCCSMTTGLCQTDIIGRTENSEISLTHTHTQEGTDFSCVGNEQAEPQALTLTAAVPCVWSPVVWPPVLSDRSCKPQTVSVFCDVSVYSAGCRTNQHVLLTHSTAVSLLTCQLKLSHYYTVNN